VSGAAGAGAIKTSEGGEDVEKRGIRAPLSSGGCKLRVKKQYEIALTDEEASMRMKLIATVDKTIAPVVARLRPMGLYAVVVDCVDMFADLCRNLALSARKVDCPCRCPRRAVGFNALHPFLDVFCLVSGHGLSPGACSIACVRLSVLFPTCVSHVVTTLSATSAAGWRQRHGDTDDDTSTGVPCAEGFAWA